MSKQVLKTTNQLNKIAHKALERPHSERLLWNILEKNSADLDFSVFFLPEFLSIGFKTTFYSELNEEQKLFLNHLSYYVQYYRINGAEKIAIQNNIAIARNLKSKKIADYLLLETEEEKDHIKTFSFILSQITSHYHLDTSHLKNKFSHMFSGNLFLLNMMIKLFGADYALTYFLSRGFFNHMGKAFESEVLNANPTNNLIHQLSKMHIIDENRHTAISNLFSNCISSYLPKNINGDITQFFYTYFQNLVVKSSFSESYTKKIEFNLTWNLLSQCQLFKNFTQEQLLQLCVDHYNQITGIDEVKNLMIPKKNIHMLERADLSEKDKKTLAPNDGTRLWVLIILP